MAVVLAQSSPEILGACSCAMPTTPSCTALSKKNSSKEPRRAQIFGFTKIGRLDEIT